MQKFIIKTILLLILGLINNMIFASSTAKVRISKIVDHPALNSTVQGIIDALADSGYSKDKNLDLITASAQGSISLAQQIADKFAADKPEVIVAIGTSAAQPLIRYAKAGQKVIFSSVTDPVRAGLVIDNITGVSNFVALEPQLELLKELIPSLSKLGIIYNSGESNSVSIVDKLNILCDKMQIKLVKIAVTNSADIIQGTRELSGKVDAIFISNDNTALSAIAGILQVATKPVFCSDTDTVDGNGVVAALGPDQYSVGWQTGKKVAKILAGSKIKDLPIEYPNKNMLYLDLKAASKFSIKVDQKLMDIAEKIYK